MRKLMLAALALGGLAWAKRQQAGRADADLWRSATASSTTGTPASPTTR